jgi:hypothetical protein
MRKGETKKRHPSSFRDCSGFVFSQNATLYRQINRVYKDDYERLINSGLCRHLVDKKLLIPHQEISPQPAFSDDAYKIIRPDPIPFISYPYEWCFSQFKDAALTTLTIQKTALAYGMSIKDASPFNIQFSGGKPVLIDTLSFETYRQGKPWVAYEQFCRQFLAPLALMAHVDARLHQLLRIHLDGLPLDLTSSLLPRRTWLKFPLLVHLHLHAKSQKRFAGRTPDLEKHSINKRGFLAFLENLEKAINGLYWHPPQTAWGDYEAASSYSAAALNHKTEVVSKFLNEIKPKTVWDLGANAGEFSRIPAGKKILTIAFDRDSVAIEKLYLNCKKDSEEYLLPLVLDITNPSPGLGWANRERDSLLARGPAETLIVLALIHHLVAGQHLPLSLIAGFFRELGRTLIIEFIPPRDRRAQQLFRGKNAFPEEYSQDKFETTFRNHFKILKRVRIRNSLRSLYLMERL